jgi:hypothetical protein
MRNSTMRQEFEGQYHRGASPSDRSRLLGGGRLGKEARYAEVVPVSPGERCPSCQDDFPAGARAIECVVRSKPRQGDDDCDGV